MSVFDTLKKMITEQLNIEEDKIKPESEILKDFKADSLDLVEMLMNIEEKWDIIFDDEDIERIVNVQDVIDLIDEKRRCL